MKSGYELETDVVSGVTRVTTILGLCVFFACSLFLNSTAKADEEEVAGYRLEVNDRVKIVVFGHEDLSGEFEVDGVGRISLPLIQYVEAAGLTTRELEDAIANKLKPDYLKRPRVSVEVLSYQPVYIIGEVRQPGGYPYRNGMKVINVIALAGGYTYRASKRKIRIVRVSDENNGKQRVKEDAEVSPGDIIEVPERIF